MNFFYLPIRVTPRISGYGPVMGFCEHCNEPSGPIRLEEFLD